MAAWCGSGGLGATLPKNQDRLLWAMATELASIQQLAFRGQPWRAANRPHRLALRTGL